jgi:aspartate kinase
LRIAVQKFGGTSLATPETRERVCEMIKSAVNDGFRVVVVVSAMGRENDPYATDTLLKMIRETNNNPSPREIDLLLACGEIISSVLLSNHLKNHGISATALTGEQAGIYTDSNFGNARILYVDSKSILECLEKGIVPVVAGFQGVNELGETTTLGRGGSDTTASALGVALGAEIIDIFTDVEGVMTADPRIVHNAKLLDAITYNEICQLTREGAKIVNPRAIEIAMQSGIPLRIRSTFSGSPGTLITNQIHQSNAIKTIRDQLITGITYTSNLTQIKIKKDESSREIELKVFRSLALAGISVDFINVQRELIVFTVSADSASKALAILKNLDLCPTLISDCAKVAVVGAAMTGMPGVMAQVIEALHENHIPLLQSGDSYTNIWCLVNREHMETAVKALHDKFELGNK